MDIKPNDEEREGIDNEKKYGFGSGDIVLY